MKKIYQMIMAIAMIAMFSGCAKDGDTGPAGPAGPAGANGTNGTNGTDADVRMVMFGTQNFTAVSPTVSLTFTAPITPNLIDSSLILVYYQTGGLWYESPGLGFGGNYDTRWLISSSGLQMDFQVRDPDGTVWSGGNLSFTKVKVIFVPVNGYSGSRPGVDYSDYYATMKYFHLEE